MSLPVLPRSAAPLVLLVLRHLQDSEPGQMPADHCPAGAVQVQGQFLACKCLVVNMGEFMLDFFPPLVFHGPALWLIHLESCVWIMFFGGEIQAVIFLSEKFTVY